LALDNDEQGRAAAVAIASLFDFNKVYHVKITKYKDANEFLTNNASEEFRHVWTNAGRYLPDGIVSSFKDFDAILDDRPTDPIATFPFEGVQEKTYGIFSHKAYLITAPEGVGKTEFLRKCEHHWTKGTDLNLGFIHLEEDKARQLRGLAGYEVEAPLHLPDRQYNDEQIKRIVRDLVKRDDRLHLYTHFGSEDPEVILEAIRFMVAVCGCKIVTLDHITQVVTGLNADDSVKLLDMISTRLHQSCE
jgi:twinkle protein